jgi:hypothetical protein
VWKRWGLTAVAHEIGKTDTEIDQDVTRSEEGKDDEEAGGI